MRGASLCRPRSVYICRLAQFLTHRRNTSAPRHVAGIDGSSSAGSYASARICPHSVRRYDEHHQPLFDPLVGHVPGGSSRAGTLLLLCSKSTVWKNYLWNRTAHSNGPVARGEPVTLPPEKAPLCFSGWGEWRLVVGCVGFPLADRLRERLLFGLFCWLLRKTVSEFEKRLCFCECHG